MTKEQMLLNAAKAMGIEVTDTLKSLWKFKGSSAFNPLESLADCADMECKLNICLLHFKDYVSAFIFLPTDIPQQIVRYEDQPTKQHARMYASTMVAAMIGEKL